MNEELCGVASRPYAEVLRDLSDQLEPDVLDILVDDLVGMADNGEAGINFEQRCGTKQCRIGKVNVTLEESHFTISHLLEIVWYSPLPDERAVEVQAAADFSGNRHPKLTVIDYQHARRRAGGVVRSLIDEDGTIRSVVDKEAVGWLEGFLVGVAAVNKLVCDYWYAPKTSKASTQTLECIDGLWQPVKESP